MLCQLNISHRYKSSNFDSRKKKISFLIFHYTETDNLAKTIQSNFNLTMNELDHQIFIKLDDFRGEKEFLDDTAVMSCKFF